MGIGRLETPSSTSHTLPNHKSRIVLETRNGLAFIRQKEEESNITSRLLAGAHESL